MNNGTMSAFARTSDGTMERWSAAFDKACIILEIPQESDGAAMPPLESQKRAAAIRCADLFSESKEELSIVEEYLLENYPSLVQKDYKPRQYASFFTPTGMERGCFNLNCLFH